MTIRESLPSAGVLAGMRRGHRGLYLFAVAMAALSAVLVLAALVDHRMLLGQPVWLKPVKFAVSLAAYAATLSWLMSRLPFRSRAVKIAGWTIVVTAAIEMVWIVGAAAIDVRSHFNDSAVGALVFDAMGGVISILFFATVVVAAAVLRWGGPDRVVTAGVKAGLVISLLGMSVGVLMAVHGGHAVGVQDGGPGMLLTGWSSTGGDLRVGHFVGLHALQLLPLAAGLVAALGRDRWSERTQLRLVGVLGTTYLGVVVLVVWQALRAEPLLSPGLLTSAALLVLALGALAGTRWALAADSASRAAVAG